MRHFSFSLCQENEKKVNKSSKKTKREAPYKATKQTILFSLSKFKTKPISFMKLNTKNKNLRLCQIINIPSLHFSNWPSHLLRIGFGWLRTKPFFSSNGNIHKLPFFSSEKKKLLLKNFFLVFI